MSITPEPNVASPLRPIQVEPVTDGLPAVGGIIHAVGSRSEAVRIATVLMALKARGVPQAVARLAGPVDAPGHAFAPDGMPRTAGLVDQRPETEIQRTARALSEAETLLLEHRPALVVVAGDTDGTLALALAASKLGIQIVRLGAGLRSGDFSQSEEINRILGDRLADLLCTDASDVGDTLMVEGIASDRVRHTGNTAIDLLRRSEPAARQRAAWRRFELPAHGFVLATLHRAEQAGDELQLRRVTDALCALGQRVPVIVSVLSTTARPATAQMVEQLRASDVLVTGPLDYLDFLSLEQVAGAILTDSGAVQDEASALGVRCYTLRRSTERIVTLTHGTNILLGEDPAEIADIRLDERTASPIPLWDGHAGERVAAELEKRLALAIPA
ncbi:UDP-N-acetyl glucosamine 2-epimerase [Solirubrobacter phytolaccae]|uniref:UDP-N-acetyl glucosamine 2-epimerase n=1 Tax=Solirubrobacter phytolaccae TaxID=1404360 RepID=A0A9X3N625_9ACTN|nr:UDP-N-acetylglucosamine 2-epimerase [Solirubrobacter phytolaccae]MDA0180299.1 UDP-N-acetyl glucosamine 2-epimerase [Solirubrobacter phytolaccae]